MSQHNELIKLSALKGYTVNNDGVLFNKKGDQINLGVTKSNYKTFNLRQKNGGPRRVFIHKLQAYQKYGEDAFMEGIVVRHLDGNSLNNSFENIAIGTQSDNMMDIPKEKRILKASHPKHDHAAIVQDKINGLTIKEIMAKYSISSKGTVSFIINKSLVVN